jgi:hypothetical protein
MTPHETQLFSLLVVAASTLLLWHVFRAVKDGSIKSLAGRHQRQTDPRQFWFYVGTRAFLALSMIVFGILGARGIMHPGVQ